MNLSSDLKLTFVKCSSVEITLRLEWAGAYDNSYIAFGAGETMENMDPMVCTIKNLVLECLDHDKSIGRNAPPPDSEHGGSNDIVFHSSNSFFKDGSATFEFS